MEVARTLSKSSRLPRPGSICQICNSLSSHPLRSAKPLSTARNIVRPKRLLPTTLLTRNVSSTYSRVASVVPGGKVAADARNAGNSPHEHAQATGRLPAAGSQELSSITNMMTYIDRNKSRIFARRGIPTEADVTAALQACLVVADYITDDAVQPQIAHMVSDLDSTASTLLSLDATTGSKASSSPETPGTKLSVQVKQMMDKISDTAYAIISHPPVCITPSVLELYTEVQARLGRPETLPKVFQLFASKPIPRDDRTSLSYVSKKPNRIDNAIEPEVVEKALDTAIEARNLDAAVGIIENSYATKAFMRHKLLQRALVPAGAFAATPFAAYILATNFSGLQQTMDSATATSVAFTGILAYVGFTATLGVIAVTTANDQMKRVTWAPGVPLRKRWMREEERAALDKIACAWGFQEKWRQGEEEGADWDALREYIGQKGMVLDRTELMDGME
ncbi:hypothetical protein F4778DRAFT_424178 [Xylariomycetidae sp. FL2044]|nr:hypothetical protein F4778DRAFT_424178 [Xylariomycetidae sp. FL2044]